jgi:ubiquinone/menaquinone biosynthesis C-methylase UbiE
LTDKERLSEVVLGDVSLRLAEPHIYSMYSSNDIINSYDKSFGVFYDLVACNRLYNRLMWGYWTSEFHSFCLDALKSSTDGWVLDVGCGSLAFTVKTYASQTNRPIVFLDQSIKLLRLAKSRMIKLNSGVPQNMVFVHGDALQLPFKPKSFSTVISLNLLHVMEDIKKVLFELRNVLAHRGTISLTTLIENNRFADKYLHMWGKAGELVPRNANQLIAAFDALGMSIKYRIEGNMAFISYR